MAGKGDKSLLVSVLLVCAVVAVGVAAYVKYAPADKVVNQVKNEEPEQLGGGVTVLTPYYAEDELKFTEKQVDVPPDADPMVFAVNTYLRTTTIVPKDAQVNTVTVDEGIATLDFKAAFETTYGTFDESTVINGILATMGQFEDVSFVKFTVEGRQLETLGNMELIDPLAVIRLTRPVAGEGGDTSAKS